MPKFKFLMSRTSLIEESWWVEADTEEEAMELALDGEVDNSDPDRRNWIEYYDEEWSIDQQECIDPLDRMVKDYAVRPDYFINESGLKIDVITGDMYSKEIG
jgi:hypothetical protein